MYHRETWKASITVTTLANMSREIPPYGLRMPAELRSQLERAAELAGRSLNAEINARLLSTLDEAKPHGVQPAVCEPSPEYGLTQPERDMLTLFRRWSAPKQLGFLVLFQ